MKDIMYPLERRIDIEIEPSFYDPSHVDRRKQQRAISEDMIQICLRYGHKQRIRGSIHYTIRDKSIINTSYSKYIDRLRGLTVVCSSTDNDIIKIKTVMWHKQTRRRKATILSNNIVPHSKHECIRNRPRK